MRRIRPDEHRSMPWRNGGGVTSEILVEPADGRFLYRLSIADVTSDGPFSTFEGYDRHICLLEGAGMMLDAGSHGQFSLARYQPCAFSGDWPVTGRLPDGPVRDLNLIVDRAWGSSTLAIEDGPVHVVADICIVHILGGDTFVAEGALEVDGGRMAVGRIVRK